jgi:hypothetical protein
MTNIFTKLASAVTALALVASFVPVSAIAADYPYQITVAGDLSIEESSAIVDPASEIEARGIEPITLTLSKAAEGEALDGSTIVRIAAPNGVDSNLQLWAYAEGQGWFDTAQVGWGGGSGFPLQYALGDMQVYPVASNGPQTYTLSFDVENADTNEVIAAQTANLEVAAVTSATVTSQDQLLTALADEDIQTITIGSDFPVTSSVAINRSVTISGNEKTITGDFVKTSTSNNSVLLVTADNVAIRNLTVDAESHANSLHGIHVYQASGVTLDSVVARNALTGINVNDSDVTVTNVTTSGNLWGGINVDKGTATLNISGDSAHSDVGPAVWKDDNSNTEVAITGNIAQYTSVEQQVNTTMGTLYYLSTAESEDELVAALANAAIPTITIGDSFSVTTEVSVNRTVSILGNEKTITASGGLSGSVMLVTAPNVTISDLTVDGDDEYVHGIHAYVTTGTTLTDVTLKDNGKSGLLVNGSTVTVTNLTTTGNAWNGVNVDQGGNVTAPATLTVNGTSEHDEADAIWIDSIAKTGVSVVDTNSQYVSAERAWTNNAGVNLTGRVYVLAPEENDNNGRSGRSGGSRRVTTNTNTGGEVAGAATGPGEVLGASTYNFTADLTIGSTGADVNALQAMLIASGDLAITAPTGYFGEMTRAALVKWQARHSVPATGYFGPLTRAAVVAAGTPAPTMTDAARAALIADLLAQVALIQERLAEMVEEGAS